MGGQYDCIIVGAGPAGLGAALYAARDRFSTLMLEKFFPGGQINTTDRIENYPGFENIGGPDLIEKMMAQVAAFGAELKTGTEVISLRRLADGRIEVTTDSDTYTARAVILSPGSSYRQSECAGRTGVSPGGGGRELLRDLRCAVLQGQEGRRRRRGQYGRGGYAAPGQVRRRGDHGPSAAGVSRHQGARRGTDGQGQPARLQPQAQARQHRLGDRGHRGGCSGSWLPMSRPARRRRSTATGSLSSSGWFPIRDFSRDSWSCRSRASSAATGCICGRRVPGVFAAGDCRVGAAMQLVTAVADGVNAVMWMKQYFRDPSWWTTVPAGELRLNGR